MFMARLSAVLREWLMTGRFPREEFRMRPAIAWPFAIVVLFLVVALLDHA